MEGWFSKLPKPDFFCFSQTPSCMMHVNMSNREEEEEEEEIEDRKRGEKKYF
jgi:hypothetical protein